MSHTTQAIAPPEDTTQVVALTAARLPRLTAKTSTLASRFYRSAPRLADDRCWRWCPQPDVSPQVVATLDSPHGRVTLALTHDVPLEVHSTRAWSDHGDALRTLAFVSAHDTLLEWLQQALGCELTVEQVANCVEPDMVDEDALTLGFEFCTGDGAVLTSGHVCIARPCALRAARQLTPRAPGRRLTALPLRFAIEIDRIELASRALADLTAGCLVRLSNQSLGRTRAAVLLRAGRWRLPATLQERSLRLRRIDPVPTRPIVDRHTGPTDMTATQHEQVPAIAHVETLPVTLTFCAGEISLPLSAVQSLHPGQSIALERGLADTPITVYANDVAVASGDLVLIGDLLGVRIARTIPGRD